MSKSLLSSLSIAAIACGAMVALELNPASAFTLYGTSALPTSGQFERVYCQRTLQKSESCDSLGFSKRMIRS
jgi:hypothetical protein